MNRVACLLLAGLLLAGCGGEEGFAPADDWTAGPEQVRAVQALLQGTRNVGEKEEAASLRLADRLAGHFPASSGAAARWLAGQVPADPSDAKSRGWNARHVEAALIVVARIDAPQSPSLWSIIDVPPNQRWPTRDATALRALGFLGARGSKSRGRLIEIAAGDRDGTRAWYAAWSLQQICPDAPDAKAAIAAAVQRRHAQQMEEWRTNGRSSRRGEPRMKWPQTMAQ